MNTIWIVMPILIVLMFLLGTELNKEAFINVARHPKALVLGLQMLFAIPCVVAQKSLY